MSSISTRDAPLRRYQIRKETLNLDLNILAEASDLVENSSDVDAEAVLPIQQQNAPPFLIDVETFDDDVMISSARDFAQARNNARRSRLTNVAVVDVDSEEQTARFANCYKRRRNSSDCHSFPVHQVYIDLESCCNSKKERCVEQPKIVLPPPPPPPPEPAISCPICMGELVEEMTTKCGHVFCKKCIQTAISVKSVCPTCRKKVIKRDIRRIYLPTIR